MDLVKPNTTAISAEKINTTPLAIHKGGFAKIGAKSAACFD
jgi:hypothetical protein